MKQEEDLKTSFLQEYNNQYEGILMINLEALGTFNSSSKAGPTRAVRCDLTCLTSPPSRFERELKGVERRVAPGLRLYHSLATGASTRFAIVHCCLTPSRSRCIFLSAGKTNPRRFWHSRSAITDRLRRGRRLHFCSRVLRVVSEPGNDYNFPMLFSGAGDHSGIPNLREMLSSSDPTIESRRVSEILEGRNSY
ncbi:hypothetical protein M9H77_28421 [Catharanthus roseus]|uniref:Uncharacterized protein n=1 Tax=Catharanthus roseus TaxID=4058 RepID=A0ACC0AI01_CATRO|nr:hypothetical protein M9H77_28421 [Catharanthus roseus]